MLFLCPKHGACCYPASFQHIALGYKRLCTKKSRSIYKINQKHSQIPSVCHFCFSLENKFAVLFNYRFVDFSPAGLPVQCSSHQASLVCLLEGRKAVQGKLKLLPDSGCRLTCNTLHTCSFTPRAENIQELNFSPLLALITWEIVFLKKN